MRKASAVILMLCLAVITMEINSHGQGLLDKLKLPKLPPPSGQNVQTAEQEQQPHDVDKPLQASQPAVQENDVSPQVPAATEDAQPSSSDGTLRSLDALNFHEGDFDWRKDWWKALLFILGGLAIVTILLGIARRLFRYIVLTACFMAGYFGARYFGPPLAPWVETKLPSSLTQALPPLYWSCIFVFLLCYVLATIVLVILKRPLDIMDKQRKCKSGKME